MLSWQLWNGAIEEWDESLSAFADNTVFQSFGWGEYKKAEGWTPVRYLCVGVMGEKHAIAQILIKNLPFSMAFVWIPGGPVFDFTGFKNTEVVELSNKLICKIREEYPRSLIRLNSHRENDNNLSYEFDKVFFKPYAQLNSGFSVQIKLKQFVVMLRNNMTSKHRYYTKKAAEKGLRWHEGYSDNQLITFVSMYDEMVKYKKLPYNVCSLEALFKMRENMGASLLVLTGFLGETPVASCLVLVFGQKAFYMSASTSRLGREISASYAMFEQLINILDARSISDFDFGGVDLDKKSAAGVNHFKIGFGGKVIEYLGEWESASSMIVRVLINLAIRIKVGRR
jgi:lipid II:glycine glycyltransferase (peptidoglycan interpeptide bridge formation enzyme)